MGSTEKLSYTKAFKHCDYKFKIEAIRISENTFAGHWETVVDCMENIRKCSIISELRFLNPKDGHKDLLI